MMTRTIALLMLCAAAAVAQATTYDYASSASPAAAITNFTNCTQGPCASYAPTARITGSFTTASPLPPNFAGDATALVTDFSFTDGVNIYARGDPALRRHDFLVYTDAAGVPLFASSVFLELWETGVAPHQAGDRVSFVQLILNGAAYNNLPCAATGTPPGGDSDSCVSAAADAATSLLNGVGPGQWSIASAAAVPAPGAPLLLPLAALLLFGGTRALRARKAAGDGCRRATVTTSSPHRTRSRAPETLARAAPASPPANPKERSP
jgi:hypothetical protein